MELIYLFDPLCGWCYGFGHQLEIFKNKYQSQLNYTVISGGMVTGSRVGSLSEIAPNIQDSTPRVEQLSGIKFGEAFMNDLRGAGNTILDSTPPSKAFVILKETFPSQQVELAHKIQSLFYSQGLDLNRVDSYLTLCTHLGYDLEEFKANFEGLTYQLATKDEFVRAANFGVSGYPTVVLRQSENYYLVSNGFTTAEKLEGTIHRIVEAEGLG